MPFDAEDGGEAVVIPGERRRETTETVIEIPATIPLSAVSGGWPLSVPVLAGATWLHRTIDCASPASVQR